MASLEDGVRSRAGIALNAEGSREKDPLAGLKAGDPCPNCGFMGLVEVTPPQSLEGRIEGPLLVCDTCHTWTALVGGIRWVRRSVSP